jgi:hypothetical protein
VTVLQAARLRRPAFTLDHLTPHAAVANPETMPRTFVSGWHAFFGQIGEHPARRRLGEARCVIEIAP